MNSAPDIQVNVHSGKSQWRQNMGELTLLLLITTRLRDE